MYIHQKEKALKKNCCFIGEKGSLLFCSSLSKVQLILMLRVSSKMLAEAFFLP